MLQWSHAQISVETCALIDELRKQGIVATVGYDSNYKKRENKLLAYVRAENAFRVPREWRGFSVTVRVDNSLSPLLDKTVPGFFYQQENRNE